MRSKLLEATVIMNGKTTELVNTSMEINVMWKVDVLEQQDSAAIHIRIFELNGTFEICTKVDSCLKKKCEYKFHTDGTWKAETDTKAVNIQKNMLEPVSALIDFDNKKATIKF